MIDVDAEAGAQLVFCRGPRKFGVEARMKAVERALVDRETPIAQQYAALGIAGSTFFFWRCEYVTRRYAEDLEETAQALQAQLEEQRRYNAALQSQLAQMHEAQGTGGQPRPARRDPAKLAGQLMRLAQTLKAGPAPKAAPTADTACA